MITLITGVVSLLVGIYFGIALANHRSRIDTHQHSFVKIGEFHRQWRPATYSMIPMKGLEKFANVMCAGCGETKEISIGGVMHDNEKDI